MIFIFGWGHKTHKIYGSVSAEDIDMQSPEGFHKLIRTRTWFTAFFLPLIPTKTQYFLISESNSSSIEITVEDFNKLKPLAILNNLVTENKIDEEEYYKRRRDINF